MGEVELMPWHIGTSDRCPASRPHAVINERTGEVERGGCHATREEAVAHQRALYANEPAASRAQMSSGSINDLPDSAFAYIEPGGKKDDQGKTAPRSLRHFPIHDAPHVRNALARAPQSPFGAKAMAKIRAAAKKFGIEVSGDGRSMEGSHMEIEGRDTPGLVEVRATGDSKRIGGYAAVFSKLSRNLGGFVERANPSAFNKSRGDGWPSVVARYNHNSDMVLGTIAGRTLELRVDETGLWYEVTPPVARADVLELVARGDIQHSSFAFRVPPGGDEWTTTDQNYPMRSLNEVHLVDVSPVLTPAYPDTSAALRSFAEHFGADPVEVRSMAASDELRKFFVRTDVTPPSPRLFGPVAAAALLERRTDPWA